MFWAFSSIRWYMYQKWNITQWKLSKIKYLSFIFLYIYGQALRCCWEFRFTIPWYRVRSHCTATWGIGASLWWSQDQQRLVTEFGWRKLEKKMCGGARVEGSLFTSDIACTNQRWLVFLLSIPLVNKTFDQFMQSKPCRVYNLSFVRKQIRVSVWEGIRP